MLNIFNYFLAQIQPTGLPTPNFDLSFQSILRIIFMVAAILSVIFVAVGGLKYTLSSGDPQGIAKAKNTIIAAVVGLILAISAFTILGFIAGRL